MLYYVVNNIYDLSKSIVSVNWVGRGAQKLQCRSTVGAVAKELRKFCTLSGSDASSYICILISDNIERVILYRR